MPITVIFNVGLILLCFRKMSCWIFAIIIGCLSVIQCCPTGCGCGLKELECEHMDADTVLYRNVLIVKATFKDSIVDVKKLMEAFPNLQEVYMQNSQAYNCPRLDTGIKGLNCGDSDYTSGTRIESNVKMEENIEDILQISQGSLSLGVLVFVLTLAWIGCRFYFFVNRRLRARQNLLRRADDGNGGDGDNLLMRFIGRHADQLRQQGQQQQQRQQQPPQAQQQRQYPFQVVNTI